MRSALAALLLALGTVSDLNADVGRLFFTPAERSMLDNARKNNRADPLAATPVEIADSATSHKLNINGVVRRSDGQNTVWVNSSPVTGRRGDLAVTPRSDNSVRLTVPDSGRSIDLKVGQSAEIVSRSIPGVPKQPAAQPVPKPAAAEDAAKITPPSTALPPKSDPVQPWARNVEREPSDKTAPDSSQILRYP